VSVEAVLSLLALLQAVIPISKAAGRKWKVRML
jgi:hypothetical protein